jgi:transcriptional regulator with XRE-family HTH domain
MSENLKIKITEYLENSDSSIQAFERKAKLSRNAVYSILTDKSKNPNIETILKIADVLNCSLDELFERKNLFKRYTDKQLFKTKLNIHLFKLICSYVNNYVEQNKINELSLGHLIETIEEIYKYCLSQKSDNIDEHFAEWFLKNNLFNMNLY